MEFESQENMYPNLQSFQQEGKAMYQVEPQNAYMNNGGQLFADQTTFYSNMNFGQNYMSQNANNIPTNFMNQQNFMSQPNYVSQPNFMNQNMNEMNMNNMIDQQSFMNGQQGFIKSMNAPQLFISNMNATPQNYGNNMNLPQNFGSNMTTSPQNFMANSFGNDYVNVQGKQTNQEEDGNDEEFKPEEVVDEESSEEDDEEYEPEEPIDINSDNNFNLEDYLRVRDQL